MIKPAHIDVSKMTSEYLANKGINTMTTPDRSPNTMPIENVFTKRNEFSTFSETFYEVECEK